MVLSTIREDYASEWFGSLAASWLDTRGTTLTAEKIRATPMYCWRGQQNTTVDHPHTIETALQFVRAIRTIAPEDFVAVYDLFSVHRPTEHGLRAVLSYIGGTSTTLFLLPLFHDRPNQQVFITHFERIFASSVPEPVLLRLLLSMVPDSDPAFVYWAARLSIACVQHMEVFLQSGKLDPNYYGGENSLLVLACLGAHHAVVEALVTRSSRELVIVALQVATRGSIVLLLLQRLFGTPFVDDRDILLSASTHGHIATIHRFLQHQSAHIDAAVFTTKSPSSSHTYAHHIRVGTDRVLAHETKKQVQVYCDRNG
jgi:hypothetical protein